MLLLRMHRSDERGDWIQTHTSVRRDCSLTCLPLAVSRIWSSEGMLVSFAIHARRASKDAGTGLGHWMHPPAGIVNICNDMRGALFRAETVRRGSHK
jgi:hypothetical protein